MAINHNLQLKELMEYHEITEVYKNSVACFRLDSNLVNIDTVSPTFADMFSLLLVQSGEAVFPLTLVNIPSYEVICCCSLQVYWLPLPDKVQILWQ